MDGDGDGDGDGMGLDALRYGNEEFNKYLGGDENRAHLVKGLDVLLLQRNLQKENDELDDRLEG